MKIPPPLIPKEHGAWAVLFVPLIVGASIAGKFTLNVLWLALGTLAVFMSYAPAQTLLRARLVSPPAPERARAAKFWAAAHLIFGALFMLPLFLRGLWWLLAIGILSAIAFIVNFLLTRRYSKTVLSDLISVLGLTLSAPAAYYAVTGKLDQTAALLWLMNFLFFGSGIVYVHTKLRAAALKQPQFSFGEKLSLGKLNLIYHLIVLAIVGILAAHNFTPLFAAVAFVPMTIHAIYGTLKLSSTVRFKNLGLILLLHSFIFALLFAISASLIWAQTGKAQPSTPPTVNSIESKTLSNTNLQALINAAAHGDTIFVPTGIYEGNLIIDKKLVLIGRDQPVIRGDGNGSTVLITADSCTFRGFVVERSGKMLVHEDAGILIKSDGNLVAENKLRDILFGIYLLGANNNAIIANRIVGRKELELGERGSGIHIWNSQHNRFIGNVITDARDGFYIQNANHTHIERSEVFNLRYGVHYMYADSNVFLHNQFYGNVAGAAIMYSRGIVMRHNRFVRNRGFASFGILFQDCHGSIADSNIIADNVVGMFFEASTNNLFRHNIIAQNDVALQMFQNSERNTFAENNFIDNLNPLSLVGKRTLTHWSQNGRGNYWSAYDGYDLDHDGIGDVPMKIQNVFDYLEGRYPNLRLYLYSPASQALATAAKAFPIIEITQEMDEHPLMRPVDLQELTKPRDKNLLTEKERSLK
ncbi:MAG: YwiC-like family protein [candidate division KSB1 bacterium]|nr:YwiC-like family protein [candidate division KSB1 bacterium]MDZ7367608.1 YwiC-like family protein [candidate division KSB1 bacterium]MDZ7405400.1 YwiC-like family protein [candidate division KSB1 bacterium]